jgi:hypothetical protein
MLYEVRRMNVDTQGRSVEHPCDLARKISRKAANFAKIFDRIDRINKIKPPKLSKNPVNPVHPV